MIGDEPFKQTPTTIPVPQGAWLPMLAGDRIALIAALH